MSDEHYVYLLRDPREPDFHRSIFYVGKGTSSRALAHRADALSRMDILDDPSEDDAESIRAKEDRLREIHDAGCVEAIDVLLGPSLTPIPESTAFAVESALIEVLRRGQSTGLTNRVRGHRLRLTPATALAIGTSAQEVSLPEGVAAVIVPVNGLRGGRDYAGTLSQATDDEIWENCRRAWSRFSAERLRVIRDRAGSDNPVLVLGLAENQTATKSNVIIGVYSLKAVHESHDPANRKGGYYRRDLGGRDRWVEEYAGWVLERDDTKPSLSSILLHQTLTEGGTPKRRPQDRAYVGDW